MRLRILPLLLTCAVAGFASAQDVDVVRVDKRSLIPIVLERSGKMEKPDWDGSFPEPTVVSIEPTEIERSVRLIKQAMAKYPVAVLKKHLKKVYIAKDITVDNYSYGGTYAGDTLYLANAGTDQGFDDAYLEQTFHHEFSSVLMSAKPARFSERRWRKLNPPGFKYIGYDRVWSNDPSVTVEPAPGMFVKGFWSTYATVSVEEDFNTMAENVFAGGPMFWDACAKNPRLAAKMKETVRFYGMLDVSFTEWRFRQYAKHPPEGA
jgi:hypothetical protein